MPYLPLPNFNHDSGPRRIQSGPDHEGYVVLYSGVESTGADDGFAVLGAPLSGTLALGAWDYDSNWRYVPSTLPSQSGSLDPTPYNVSGALDTYDATRIYTRDNVAGAQAASAIGPETGKVNPRGAALQARSDVTRPETYMYYGGAAPDNQDYSPYNTPDANSAAEGKTGGGVTHKSFESSLLTNVLGSQGTSDRSQWRYHQPVYCKTYTETRRSETPGLMSTPLRYVYRGAASSYNYNYGGQLLANKGGFELLPYDDEVLGCPFPVGCPLKTGNIFITYTGDIFTAVVPCDYVSIDWYNTSSAQRIGVGLSYTAQLTDVGHRIYFVVTYPDSSTDSSSVNCYTPVEIAPVSLNLDFFIQYTTTSTIRFVTQSYPTYYDNDGIVYCLHKSDFSAQRTFYPIITAINAARNSLLWSCAYWINDGYSGEDDASGESFSLCADSNYLYLFITRLDTVDYRKTRLHLLTVNKSDGQVISDHGAEFTNTSTTPSAAIRKNGRIGSSLTRGSGEFWLTMETPLNIDQCASIMYVSLSSSGLVVNWCYIAALKNNRTSAVTTRTSAFGLCLSFVNNKLLCSPYGGSNNTGSGANTSAGANLTQIDPYTGAIEKRRQFFITEGSSIAAYLDSTIDEDENEYYVYVDTTSYTVQTKFYMVKTDPAGNYLWTKSYINNIRGINITSPAIVFNGSNLILCVEHLVGGVTPNHFVVLFTIDKSTGNLLRSTVIRPPVTTGNGWSQLFNAPKIHPWKVENEYFIDDSVGYRLGVNIPSIPIPFYSGGSINSLSSNTPSGYYVFTERSTANVSGISAISGAANVAPLYSYTDYGTVTPFTLSTNSIVVSGAMSTTQYRYISKLA